MIQNSLLRTRAILGVPETIEELGGDPDRFLGEFGLRREMIDDPKHMMPYPTLIQLMERAAEEFGCPDFGLRVGVKQGMTVLGPIAMIAQNSATVREALAGVVKYIWYHSPSIQLSLEPTNDARHWALTFDISITQGQARAQTVEMSILVGVSLMRVLLGQNDKTFPVQFRHARISPAARYRTIFNNRVTFNARSNAVLISAEDLSHVIPSRDPVIMKTMEEYVASKMDCTVNSLKNNVRSLLISLLPAERRCTISLIARHMAVSERTLQRALKKEDVVFEEMVDVIRRELAEDYLKEGDMPISQVAGLIGYGQQSSFNRACVRWFGKSPKAIREELTLS